MGNKTSATYSGSHVDRSVSWQPAYFGQHGYMSIPSDNPQLAKTRYSSGSNFVPPQPIVPQRYSKSSDNVADILPTRKIHPEGNSGGDTGYFTMVRPGSSLQEKPSHYMSNSRPSLKDADLQPNTSPKLRNGHQQFFVRPGFLQPFPPPQFHRPRPILMGRPPPPGHFMGSFPPGGHPVPMRMPFFSSSDKRAMQGRKTAGKRDSFGPTLDRRMPHPAFFGAVPPARAQSMDNITWQQQFIQPLPQQSPKPGNNDRRLGSSAVDLTVTPESPASGTKSIPGSGGRKGGGWIGKPLKSGRPMSPKKVKSGRKNETVTTAELHRAASDTEDNRFDVESKSAKSDAIYETLKQKSIIGLGTPQQGARVTEDARIVLERNAQKVAHEDQISSSPGRLPSPKEPEYVNEVDIEARIVPILPSKKIKKPKNLQALDAWNRIPCDDHRLAQKRPLDDANFNAEIVEDVIVPRIIEAPPPKHPENQEPIYLEYEHKLLPDFKKRLIETGSFDIEPVRATSTPTTDHSFPRKETAPQKTWGGFLENAYYPAKNEMVQKIDSSIEVLGHDDVVVGVGSSKKSSSDINTEGKRSVRQLKNSVTNLFRRSKSSSRENLSDKSPSEMVIGQPQLQRTSLHSSYLNIPPNGLPRDDTTHSRSYSRTGTSEIDFSWIKDLEDKLGQKSENYEILAQRRAQLAEQNAAPKYKFFGDSFSRSAMKQQLGQFSLAKQPDSLEHFRKRFEPKAERPAVENIESDVRGKAAHLEAFSSGLMKPSHAYSHRDSTGPSKPAEPLHNEGFERRPEKSDVQSQPPYIPLPDYESAKDERPLTSNLPGALNCYTSDVPYDPDPPGLVGLPHFANNDVIWTYTQHSPQVDPLTITPPSYTPERESKNYYQYSPLPRKSFGGSPEKRSPMYKKRMNGVHALQAGRSYDSTEYYRKNILGDRQNNIRL